MGFFSDIINIPVINDGPPSPWKQRPSGSPIDNILDAIDPVSIAKRGFFGKNADNFTGSKGDHLVVQRIGYTHHGIYIGSDMVIHYDNNEISKISLDDFSNGSKICRKKYSSKYSRDEIVNRALARLGENDYNILFNNCEQFANWCRTGRKYR